MKLTLIALRYSAGRLEVLCRRKTGTKTEVQFPYVQLSEFEDGRNQMTGYISSLIPNGRLERLFGLALNYAKADQVATQNFVALIRTSRDQKGDLDDTQWVAIRGNHSLNRLSLELLDEALICVKRETLLDSAALHLLDPPFRMQNVRQLFSQIWHRRIKPRRFKAWLMKRQTLRRVSPGRYRAREGSHPHWLDPF